MTVSVSRFLSFRAAGRVQLVEAGAVQEVVRLPRTTRVPHAPAGVVGLANIRGTALPILSVASLQGKAVPTGDRVLVLDRTPAVGLLVDEVYEIVDNRARTRRLDVDALVARAFGQAPARAAPTTRCAAHSGGAAFESGVDRARLNLLSFVSGGQEFALPLDHVAEVVAMPNAITRLPDVDNAVIGMIDHRGELLPILALAHLLGLTERADPPTRLVIATLKGHRVGLAVDAMRSVLAIDETAIDPVPTLIARRSGEARIQAIARMNGGHRLVSILSADLLVDEALIAQLGDRRDTSNKGSEDMASVEATEPFLIFRLGDQSFGLPALAVDEVVRLPETLTRLPRAPDFVEGVMNLRGGAIPVIDQRRRFGGEASADLQRRAIVVRLGTLQAAFVIDEVMRIHRISAVSIAPAPYISNDTRIFDRTALMPDGSIVLLIEPAELLDGTERDLLSALRVDPAAA